MGIVPFIVATSDVLVWVLMRQQCSPGGTKSSERFRAKGSQHKLFVSLDNPVWVAPLSPFVLLLHFSFDPSFFMYLFLSSLVSCNLKLNLYPAFFQTPAFYALLSFITHTTSPHTHC